MKKHTFRTILLLSVLGTACASDNPDHHSEAPTASAGPAADTLDLGRILWRADAEGAAFKMTLPVEPGEVVGLVFTDCGALGYANAKVSSAVREDAMPISTSTTFCRRIGRGETKLDIEIPAYAPGPAPAAGCRLELVGQEKAPARIADPRMSKCREI